MKTELDPLDYLLSVINDPEAQPTRRDRLALAALPYCHARVSDKRLTKKQERMRRVTKVGAGDGHGWRKDISDVAPTNGR